MKPPVTDSLLLSGSKEGDMLTAPFKSCWRPNLWLQGEFMWIVIIKTCPVHFSDKQLSTGRRGELSSSERAACIFLISRSSIYHSAQLHWPQHFAITLHQWLHHEATSHWFIASQWQQGRGHVNCSIQILLEAESVASGWIYVNCHHQNVPRTFFW